MNNIREFAGTLPAEIKQYGDSSHNSGPLRMRAGRLTMHCSEGSLRHISCGNKALQRGLKEFIKDDWKKVFEPDNVRDQILSIT